MNVSWFSERSNIMVSTRAPFPFIVLVTLIIFHLTEESYASPKQIYECVTNKELASVPFNPQHIPKFESQYDVKKRVVAYRNSDKMFCFIQKTWGKSSYSTKPLLKSMCLTDSQLVNFAGEDIYNFCKGYKPLLVGTAEAEDEDINNTLDSDELLEEAMKYDTLRVRRNADSISNLQYSAPVRGRYRGQTQSQYLNFNSGDAVPPGRAEAESTPTGSRAVVSGKSGMGQAQSQSGFSSGCEDCYGQSQIVRDPYAMGGKIKTPYDQRISGGPGFYPETEVISPRGDRYPSKFDDDRSKPFTGYPPATGTQGKRPGEKDSEYDRGRNVVGQYPSQDTQVDKYPQQPSSRVTPGYTDQSKYYPGSKQVTTGPTEGSDQRPPTSYESGGRRLSHDGAQGYLPGDPNAYSRGDGESYQPDKIKQEWRPTYPGSDSRQQIGRLPPGHENLSVYQGGPKPQGQYFGQTPSQNGQTPSGGDGSIYRGQGPQTGQDGYGQQRPEGFYQEGTVGKYPGSYKRPETDRTYQGANGTPGSYGGTPGIEETPGRYQGSTYPGQPGVYQGSVPPRTGQISPGAQSTPGTYQAGVHEGVQGGRQGEGLPTSQGGIGTQDFYHRTPGSGAFHPESQQGIPGPNQISQGAYQGVPGGRDSLEYSGVPGTYRGTTGPYQGTPGTQQRGQGGIQPAPESYHGIPGRGPGEPYQRETGIQGGRGIQRPGDFQARPGTTQGVSGYDGIGGGVPGSYPSYQEGGGPGIQGSVYHKPPGAYHEGAARPEGDNQRFGTQGTYPGVPVTQQGSTGTYPGQSVVSGGYPSTYQEIPGQLGRQQGTYPGKVGITQGLPGTYPGTVGGTQVLPGTYPGTTGGITQGSPGTYPGTGVTQGLPGAYPGRTGGTAQGTPGSYPGTTGGIQGTPGTYPGTTGGIQGTPGTYPGTVGGTQGLPGTYPGITGGITQGSPGAYPGTVGVTQGIPGTYPGAVVAPGSYPGTGLTQGTPGGYPGTAGPTQGGKDIYQQPGVTGHGQYPSTSDGTNYPGTGQNGIERPGFYTSPQGTYDRQYEGPQGPATYHKTPGQVHEQVHLGGRVPYQDNLSRGQDSQGGYPPTGARVSQQWDGRGPGTTQEYSTYNQGGRVTSMEGLDEEDDANSQAQTSIKRLENGTFASSSSNGMYGGGSAQSQISGTYSGSGSFSAQAQTIEGNRGAQSQIIAGEKGVQSSAQGRGGRGQSQVQMQLGTEMGETIAEAQSTGISHGTNTQVKASSKGGLADAQASGPGSTSSQAQIGFQPQNEEGENPGGNDPFYGGGTASAQSGKYDGQSQTQIQGRFKYGISYNGAAQAGSGIKDGVARNRTFMKPLNLFGNNNIRIDRDAVTSSPQTNKTENNDSPKDVFEESESVMYDSVQLPQQNDAGASKTKNNPVNIPNNRPKNIPHFEMNQKQSPVKSDASDNYDKSVKYAANVDDYDESEEDDYDGEFYQSTEATHQELNQPREVVIQQNGRAQKQHIILGPINKNGIHIVKDSTSKDSLKEGMVFQPGEEIPGTQGYTIPIGFRGRVSSVSDGDDTYAYADENGESQAQTITLTPGNGNITYGRPAHKNQQSVRSWNPNNSRHSSKVNSNNLKSSFKTDNPDNGYVTVTKSITGELNQDKTGLVEDKKFSHTYYTKSSTCGYFTFTCNLVYGSQGRTKICKPTVPTNPDGTPINC